MTKGRSGSNADTMDDLVTLVQIVLLFVAVLVGREVGNVYSNYREVSRLSVVMQVSEEELAGFIRGVLAGNDTDLNTGIGFTQPYYKNVEGQVFQVPDYVRRWFISVTFSAITVHQPEVSDIEVQLWVEGESIQTNSFAFERDKVNYMSYFRRTIALHLDDKTRFSDLVQRSSEKYGGEVEIKLAGRALAHVEFFEVWLPFSTTSYPLVRTPHVNYLESEWTDTSSNVIQRSKVGGRTYISVRMQNPTRVHSIWENVTATVYKVGSDEPISSVSKVIAAASGSKVTYVFPFSPEEAGSYRYSLTTSGGFQVAPDQTPILEVEPS